MIALWVQLFSALAFGAVLPLSFTPIYTIIWIAVAVHYYPLRTCWWLLLAILLAWFGIMSAYWDSGDAFLSVILYGTFHLFALLSSGNALAADAAREEVEALNRELVATQELLAEASRQGERTRIARDLHDLLGHHLTALSINLQIAERISDGEARTQVGECRALARLLLSDVREAVDELRDSDAVDLRCAIERLAATATGTRRRTRHRRQPGHRRCASRRRIAALRAGVGHEHTAACGRAPLLDSCAARRRRRASRLSR